MQVRCALLGLDSHCETDATNWHFYIPKDYDYCVCRSSLLPVQL